MRFPGARYSGIGVVIPKQGNCIVTPMRQAVLVLTGLLSISVDVVLDNGEDMVVALVTEHAERHGARVAFPAVHVWHVEEGKAIGFQAFQHDDHEMDEFWS